MELNPRQQKLAFAVIVVILAGLGVYLLLPDTTRRAARRDAASRRPRCLGRRRARAAARRDADAAGELGGEHLPVAAVLAKRPGQRGRRRGAGGGVLRHLQLHGERCLPTASRMSNLVTSQYLQVLESDYATYGVAKQRTEDKEISTATAVVNSLRSFGSSSLTFVVTISQHIQQVSGTSSPDRPVRGNGGQHGRHWQVDQIQPASAGNQ